MNHKSEWQRMAGWILGLAVALLLWAAPFVLMRFVLHQACGATIVGIS